MPLFIIMWMSMLTCAMRFLADKRGGIIVMAALAMPILVGAGSLAVGFSRALFTKAQNQRTVDLAAYAGALAYQQTGSLDTMRATGVTIATLNGLAAENISISLVNSPRTSGAQAVLASIMAPQSIVLGRVLGASGFTVTTSAMAEIGGKQSPGCIIALDPNGSGVTLSGGTNLSAPSCTVASNSTITSPCGTTIIASQATYNSANPPDQPQWCRTIQKRDGTPAPIIKAAVSDPLASNAGVQVVTNRLANLWQITSPPSPAAVNGNDLDFNPWDQTKLQALAKALAAQNCSGVYASGASEWTVTCSGTSFYFGKFYVPSSVLVQFNLKGSAGAVYNFKSILSAGGGKYQFGAGTYNVPGGITAGGDTASFGAGTFNIGQGPCGFSICSASSGTMSFDGPSHFSLSNGIQVNGSTTATLGSGTRNSFAIGSYADTAIQVNSGSLVLADIGSGTFPVAGRITTGGGTCLALPVAAQHDIDGSIDVAGALILGAGPYAINGYLALGAQNGGSANCNGQSNVSLLASNVTIALGGKELVPSGSCQGTAYCASAGYAGMVLTSPASGPLAQLAIIGPTTTTGGATLTGGAGGGTTAGAFYFPKGAITFSGGASTSGTSAGCLAIVGLSISLSGGTAAATDCSILAGGGGRPRFVLVN